MPAHNQADETWPGELIESGALSWKAAVLTTGADSSKQCSSQAMFEPIMGLTVSSLPSTMQSHYGM
jgi:hypothetical protein